MTGTVSRFDVVIVGAGPVGCAAALALESLGLTVCVLDPKPLLAHPAAANPQDPWDVRVLTISPGSEQLLRGLGVWARLDASRLGTLYRMEVHGDLASGAITFDAQRIGVSHLASVVENGRLQRALEQEISRRSGMLVLAPATIESIDWTSGEVQVVLRTSRAIRGHLLVGADGADSFVRAQARIGVAYGTYGQQGVVANFEAEKAHVGRAFQWFRPDGVLAFLPLPGHMLSMVWSTPAKNAARLCALGLSELTREVREASGDVLGALKVVTPPRSFPLRYLRAKSFVGLRTALLGDAAHSVHPLAGQGVNLGFRDVDALARVLGELPLGADAGVPSLLRKYQSERLEDTMSVFAVTDGLQKLFAAPNPLIRALRNRGMSAVDRFSPVKYALMRRAML